MAAARVAMMVVAAALVTVEPGQKVSAGSTILAVMDGDG